MTPTVYDVIVIGGGQSGLAVAYYLNRAGLNYVVLDASDDAGGSWQHYWHSLRLFSPAQWSSLPGVLMTGGPDYYPTRNETIDYLRKYEEKYKFAIQRGVTV
ncbi:MAG: FAD-dependent oxidoreductase, partial [Imperialibacter sp.]